ncbi:MAG: DUF6518 family protein [Actinomycetota bacterium]|nr:DUF6518 family protein [Actinomycetota bacterium]
MQSTQSPASSDYPIRLLLLVGGTGTGLGILTAYAQGWLPQQVGSLANSSGSWCIVAILLALLATRQLAAAVCGAAALASLLVGYVIGAAMRGDQASGGLMAFWILAAIVVGPLLGIAAHWVKSRNPTFSAVGAGGIAGLLIGEGAYGLLYIADSTYPPYWWAEIGVGIALLTWTATQRLRRTSLITLALGVTLLVAAAFVVVTRQDLIGLFP